MDNTPFGVLYSLNTAYIFVTCTSFLMVISTTALPGNNYRTKFVFMKSMPDRLWSKKTGGVEERIPETDARRAPEFFRVSSASLINF
jgi:hypothetical protein